MVNSGVLGNMEIIPILSVLYHHLTFEKCVGRHTLQTPKWWQIPDSQEICEAVSMTDSLSMQIRCGWCSLNFIKKDLFYFGLSDGQWMNLHEFKYLEGGSLQRHEHMLESVDVVPRHELHSSRTCILLRLVLRENVGNIENLCVEGFQEHVKTLPLIEHSKHHAKRS
jgi:hypothetical protein